MVLGAGVAILVGAPMMVIISIPIEGYKTGNPTLYIWAIVALIVYLLVMYFAWFIHVSKKVRQAREEGKLE